MTTLKLDAHTLAAVRTAARRGEPVRFEAVGAAATFALAPPESATPIPMAEAAGERGEGEPDEALLRLADYIDSLPEDPYKEFRTDETTAQMLRRAALGRGRETTATQIIAEAERREREASGGGNAETKEAA